MERLKTPEDLRLERITKRVKTLKEYYKHLISYILVNTFLLLLTYFRLKENEPFWEFSTFSVAFFWGIGLLFHTVSVFAKNVFLGGDWEEKKIREFMEQNQKTKWE